ncbi:MAG TPA: ABC transporter substrate-binding protein [Solirubrobacteraceae bacterium]|nr:ABC transporter substrate-binding protein [Solirubrobacteraceae bacterium]
MRKTGAILTSGVALVLLLAACGGSGSSKKASLAGSSGVSKSAACQASPVHGGNLVYERQAATLTLDPLNPKNGNGDIFAYNQIYSGLVRSDPTGQTNNIVPSLAERWTISSDGKTYTFYLRPGLKFSNGQPLTAEDVAWTLNRFGNPKINAIMAAVAGGFGHASVVNNTTVKVQLTRPVAAFLYDISIWPAFILPKNLVEKEGAAFFNHPVGTGPFMVQNFVKGSYITMVRNPYYWESGKPYLNSIRYNFVSDSNTRILAVESGSAQELDVVPFSQVSTLRANKNITVQSAKVPLFLGLWMNHARKPFADLNVRKAIQYAIDRPLINKEIFDNLGTIPNSVLMSFAMDAPDSVVKPYPYDVTTAKSLMAKSAFPHGFSTTLTYPSGTDFYEQLALTLQQELGAIGIKVKLVTQDTATVTNDWFTRAYDMIFPFASFTSDITVPDEYADFLANWGNGFMGFESNWRDPKINAMVLKFESTLDQSARAQQWAQIQQALMNVTPVMNVLSLPFVNAHRSNVCGTYLDGLGSDHLEDTWIAKG